MSPTAPPPSVIPSRRARRYELQGEIASGGMGAVYRVLDHASGQLLALKRLTQTATTDRSDVEAFEREYHVLASLDHPRIIRVFDYGVDDDGPYYTMELLPGQDLRRAAPLPYRRACLYMRDLATSLALLHGRRLIHRDLSPSNVRLTEDGHCKLFDFGALAAFGPSHQVVGTPPMIAPEAFHGAALDQRTDLYALGALAYWTLTGRHAHPARRVDDLPTLWRKPLPPPSTYAQVPPELDALVLSLLQRDPLARPASAAEVIARLDVIGELPPEDRMQAERLAQSFFVSPRFTGRASQLHELNRLAADARNGHGAVALIEAEPGMGRTRLLDEACVRMRLTGACVLAVDASAHRQPHGTAQALVLQLFDQLPELALARVPRFETELRLLGPAVMARAQLTAAGSTPPPSVANGASHELAALFIEISAGRPIMIAVDNLEDIDDASLGLIASLASLAERHALLLITGEARRGQDIGSIGAIALRRHARQLQLNGLAPLELQQLLRSIFGDAPNQERFADWLHQRAAGRPLHAIEICRRLLSNGTIGYHSGLWTLPSTLPDAEIPAALSDTLAIRLDDLSEPARELAECLSLQRGQPDLELCKLLCEGATPNALQLLDELARRDVLHGDNQGYRFSSSALRSAVVRGIDRKLGARERNHRRLGAAFERLAGTFDDALRIEAGFHLIQGEEDLRGARMIASVTHDSFRVRTLSAGLHQIGAPVEAALQAFRRHRLSLYERMPLLAALAQAGYYESRRYADVYGDEALDVLEHLSGLTRARRLRPYLGKALSLILSVLIAYISFVLTPRKLRPYGFGEIVVNLIGTVSTVIAVASISLDAVRAERVGATLEPFTFLPERTTAVGIHQFCRGLAQIGRENGAVAFHTFDALIRRFGDPRYYPTLPPEGRALYLAGAHFARGSFALFRAGGEETLESADALDATGLRLYAMIASQLRFLYFAARGELARAEPHRARVELHAAHIGSVWQVEAWEAPLLALIHTTCMNDVVGATRVVHRLDELSRTVPSLKRYRQIAADGLALVHKDKRHFHELAERYGNDEPRSYIGWAAIMSGIVNGYNQLGDYAAAKSFGERALSHVTEQDRDLIVLFLQLDLQVARADAGLGDIASALARTDKLIARFAGCDNPLLQGLLHEARAEICWNAGRRDEYRYSARETERWFRPTGTPALIAKCERLVALGRPAAQPTPANENAELDSTTVSRNILTR